ncbi:MAG: UDP-2,3-diacylglucosamine diphosphatase [Spirosomataceae bacterium]
MKELPIPAKKIYFISDIHLGAPNELESREREKSVVRWLEMAQKDAEKIFLVGDLFDFWFEFKQVVPKGYTRFLGKLAELADNGIEIIIFGGNHDMWLGDYFQKEIGAKVLREPQSFVFHNTSFFIGHGDGLGPGDYLYKGLKVLFESSIARFLFGRILHPNLALRLGYTWANHSWHSHIVKDDVYHFEGIEKEILYAYCQEIEKKKHHDFYVFGHRHLCLDLAVNETSRYINLGDWVQLKSYAVFDGQELLQVQFTA